MFVDYPLLRALRMLPAQLGPACHHWNNNDVFDFPKRLMPECQVYGCINKAEEGTSKGQKIFPVQNNKWHEISSFIAGPPIHASTSSHGRDRAHCQSQTCSAIA